MIPVFIVASVYAACVRLAGWILGRVRVRWQHGYAYFALVAAISLFLRLLGGSERHLPVPVALALGLAGQLVVGTVFFASRATNADNQPIGARRALLLSALAAAFLMLVLAGLLLLARALGPADSVPMP
jgi:hypothetical protein